MVYSDVSNNSDEALEIENFKRSRENKIEFAYDYGNLNASYVNEKINFEDDYFQDIINLDFEKIDSPFQQTSSLKPYVPNVNLEKIIIDLEDEVVSLLEKEKANLETIESLKSKKCDKEENPKVIAPGMFKLSVSQCVSSISMSKSSCDPKNVEIKLKRKRHLDTFSNIRRPKHSSVIWKKKRSSNTSNVDLSAFSHLKLNKNVKRYSHKDLLSCNNSHLGETSSTYVCNHAMNVSCNPRMCDLLDDNNFFFIDDESVKISPVSKMRFRKKPCDSMNVRSKRCSKHMTGNRALLTNFVEKFLETVRFSNNDFAVIAGYGDVIIGSMMIKKVFYVEGLVEAARTMLTFANLPLFLWAKGIATACFTQNRSIIHKRFDKTPYELINKRKLNIKFFHVFGCRSYLFNDYEDVGKLKAKVDIGVFVGYSKEYAAFRIYNKRTRKIHKSMNVNFDEISEMASKQFSLEPRLSNLNETGKSSNPLVSQVSETSKKDLEDLFQDFYDDSIEPVNVAETLRDADWVSVMQEELDHSLVIRNKARLVAVGYSQQEG
nr:retrovirus-related Pol polyprotein from transposon TNT 1-94 [Tanacetum cinerariifolium]